MNMNETFVAERRAAMHSDKLVAKPEEPNDGLGLFKRFGKQLGPEIATRMENVFNVPGWEAQTGATEVVLAKDIAQRIEPVAGNFILPVGDVSGRLFVSFAIKPIISRLAAIFGGDTGEEEIVLSAKLPSSVELLLKRMAREVTLAIGEVLDEAAMRKGETAVFHSDFAKLAVFPGQSDAILQKLTFTSETGMPIEMLLASRPATMARMLAHFSDGAAPEINVPPAILGKPFTDIPLPMRARLAQMKLPAGRLLNLKPGQTLPLAVARSVPIFVGEHRLATGVVGEQDDRVALQIDQVFMSGEVS